MTHTLAMEWAQYNIRVNSVSPGLVNTAMTYWVPQQEDWGQQLKHYGGMPRLAEVEELGGAYVYLLSDAASYTTSIDIPVNGVIGSKLRATAETPRSVLTIISSLLMRFLASKSVGSGHGLVSPNIEVLLVCLVHCSTILRSFIAYRSSDKHELCLSAQHLSRGLVSFCEHGGLVSSTFVCGCLPCEQQRAADVAQSQ